ncbi:AfsA-related hotdog domain-containing protein [Streptomyces nogalater]
MVGDNAQALLRIPAHHASLFDHPQDHLPGMVIAEGARQLALFAALDIRGLAPSKTLITELDVRFTRFGELEDDTVLSATVPRLPHAGAGEVVDYTLGGALDSVPARARRCPCTSRRHRRRGPVLLRPGAHPGSGMTPAPRKGCARRPRRRPAPACSATWTRP